MKLEMCQWKSASFYNKDFAYETSYQQFLRRTPKFGSDRKKTTKCCVCPKVFKTEIKKTYVYIHISIPEKFFSKYGEDKRWRRQK